MLRAFVLCSLLLFLCSGAPALADRGASPQLFLERGPHALRGQLTAVEDGAGLAGIRLVLSRLSWAGDPLPEPWAPAEPLGEPLGMLETDEAGFFEVRGLDEGTFQLQPRVMDAEPTRFSAGDTGGELLQLQVAAGRKLAVTVLAAGQPLEGASLLISGYQDPGSGRIQTAGDLLRYPAVSLGYSSQLVRGLPEGWVWLKAWHPEWGYSLARRVELTGDPAEAVPVVLEVVGPLLGLDLPSDRSEPSPAASEQGSYGGIGVRVVQPRGSYARIVRVFADGPAAAAGLQADDLIHELGGLDTRWMRTRELLERIQGPPGTSLELKLGRGERVLDLTVVRGEIEAQQ